MILHFSAVHLRVCRNQFDAHTVHGLSQNGPGGSEAQNWEQKYATDRGIIVEIDLEKVEGLNWGVTLEEGRKVACWERMSDAQFSL